MLIRLGLYGHIILAFK